VKSAFVTGATGFVGINIVNELVRQGWSVTCLHRAGSNLKYLRTQPVELRVGDILDRPSVEQAIPANVDAVFHVAADTSAWRPFDPAQTRTNVEGTRTMVDAARARGARRFVLTSTVSAYAPQDGDVISETTPSKAAHSWINYERSKWLAEEEVRRAARNGFPGIVVQPSAVFGPYDTSVWGGVFKVIRDGKMPALPPGAVPVNHSVEVARAHIAAVERGRVGENYILNGHSERLAHIFREMAALMGIDLRARVLPAPVFRTLGRVAGWAARLRHTTPDMTPEMADLLCRSARVETDKSERELGYRRIPLETCLKDSYEWLRAEGVL
jgi:nucleoside-diphosphate-sugar epimerase